MKTDLLKIYVKRDLIRNSRKSCLILLTIFLSFVFLSAMNLYSFSARAMLQEKLLKGHQASFMNIRPDQVEKIKQENSVRKAGIGYFFPELSRGDSKLRVSYMDEDMRDLGNLNDIEGTYPKKEDEIILSETYLRHLGKLLHIGDRIELNLGTGQKNFRITGILHKKGIEGTYPVFVSKAYVDIFGKENRYFIQLSMKSPDQYSQEQLKANIRQLGEKYHVNKNQIYFFDMYFSYMRLANTSQYTVTAGIAILLGVVSYLILHNVFYMFSLEDRQNMSLLRLIGASKKHILFLLKRRIEYFAFLGISTGILGTIVISLFINKEGLIFLFRYQLIQVILIFVLSSVYTFLILHLSVLSIKRDLKRISPKELFMSGQPTSKVVKRNKKEQVTPQFLAWLNIKRDPKKTLTMILSLSIGGVLLVSSYTFIKAFQPEKLARKEFGNYEYRIFLYQDSAYDMSLDQTIYLLQKNNPITSDFIKELEQMKNVQKVEVVQGTDVKFTTSSHFSDCLPMEGYKDAQQETLQKQLLQGTSSYEDLLKNNGVIVNQPEEFQKYYHWNVQIGDNIILERNGHKMCAKVMGISNIVGSRSYFYIPETSLQKLGDPSTNYNYVIQIELKDKSVVRQKEAETALREIIEKYPLSMDTYLTRVAEYRVSLEMTKKFFLSISFFILMMGIGNLINTYLTNIVSRKKEMDLLRLIAMKKSQMVQMLMKENNYYMKRVILLTLIGGVAISLGFHKFLEKDPILGGLNYQFPVIEFTIYAVGIYFLGSMILKRASKL